MYEYYSCSLLLYFLPLHNMFLLILVYSLIQLPEQGRLLSLHTSLLSLLPEHLP